MRYTLIGGAGFVGRNVSRALREHGHRVCIIDNLGTYHNGRIPVDLAGHDIIIRSCGDITLEDLAGSDVVVHLASKQDYWPTYADYIANNCTQLAHLFELDLAGRIGAFVLISSQTVYGQAELPYLVQRRQCEPTEQYGLSKLCQEIICQTLCPAPLYVIRPTIILGPGQNGRSIYAGIIKNTVARLHAGLPPMIYSDGEQLRCFVSVHDIARLIERIGTEGNAVPRLVNATSCEGPRSVNWVVDEVQRLMGTSIEPVRHQYVRSADAKQRDCISHCECPELWGPAVTGPALREHVESLLSGDLPSADEIAAVDAQNLEMGVVRPI